LYDTGAAGAELIGRALAVAGADVVSGSLKQEVEQNARAGEVGHD
jgi:methylmalonyl-CoA mutase cobalamin-binding subunit